MKWSFLVEATVLKPRPKEFSHKVYMFSMFFVLDNHPYEQTKQMKIDLFIFVLEARRLKTYPDFIMPSIRIRRQNG